MDPAGHQMTKNRKPEEERGSSIDPPDEVTQSNKQDAISIIRFLVLIKKQIVTYGKVLLVSSSDNHFRCNFFVTECLQFACYSQSTVKEEHFLLKKLQLQIHLTDPQISNHSFSAREQSWEDQT